MIRILFYLFFLILCLEDSYGLTISIRHSESHLQSPVVRSALDDVIGLLKEACDCAVSENNEKASVQINLPEINPGYALQPTGFEKDKSYPVLHYPEQEYAWTSKDSGGIIVLTLGANTFNAISFGLYGLLQEKLGFLFYHPRETLIPQWVEWPLPAVFQWKATPRFHKMGFHLHTQHPLELTEDLMAPYTEEARRRIREYIDWLARNQQNYFEYNLLESIHLKRWVENIKPLVEYGKQRGIIMGLDISLHMIQQKAFMLYESFPGSFRTKRNQIDRNLEKLCKAEWDVFDVEFSTTEFTKGNERRKKELQLHLSDRLVNKYGVKPMGRMHVVKKDEMLNSGQKEEYKLSPEDSLLDRHRGILIHTVMFYSMSDERAPVYHNDNLNHMMDALLEEQQQRETWYYPESAYWITFDNSVPMFLLSYLPARLDDILLCDSLGVTGHVTFSSGWEWGYWLFDWSIARWCWKHELNGIPQNPVPAQFISTLFNSKEITSWFDEALRLQEQYIRNQELIRYMTAQTVTDEMPAPFNLQLHPRPEKTYKWMRKEADAGFADSMQKQIITPLKELADKMQLPAESILKNNIVHSLNTSQQKILNELNDGIIITALRARQRAAMLASILNLEKDAGMIAEELRLEALEIVRRRESEYRYPVDLLAGKRYSHTSYSYGYLHPVHDLHFWKREEMQIKKDRWGPLFLSIWNIPRIVGMMN